jgi:type IV secretion system protein VirD4
MGPKKSNKSFYIGAGIVGYIFILLLSGQMGKYEARHPTADFGKVLSHGFSNLFSNPFDIFPLSASAFKYIGLLTIVVAFIVMALYVNQQKNHVDMPGKESGSAKWYSDMDKYNKRYTDPKGTKDHNGPNNMILSNDVFLNMDTKKTRFNNNVLVIGGSGSGKSRFFVKPNILQANCNYVVTDPAGEMLASMGTFLENQGYEIRVFNLVEMDKSHCYNPFKYIRKDEDVLTMIDCLIVNTTPPNTKGGDQFWVKSETALLQALCFYLIEKCVPEEQNFGSVMELLRLAEVDENNPDRQSPLDVMFSKLKAENPSSMAVKSYDIFKMGAGKTLKSILISCGVRLQVFNLQAVANLTNVDTIDLASIGTGDGKKALFVITPQASETYNFLVSMLYSQLFETLYFEGNKLIEQDKSFKHEVRFLLDEFVNIGQIPQFTKKLATMRKYGISCSIIIQNLAQIKALYEKDWETIIGNCDSMIFLGGLEYSTLEYISNIMGTQTIRTRNEGRSRGKNSSSSLNYQRTQRKLMNPDEVGNMDNSMCIIKIRSLDPFFTKKYDYPKHPNYHLTGDADISQRYINKLDNSLVSVNKSNSVLEAHAARYKKLKEAALRGKALYTKEVPLDEFVKNRSPDKAIELFDRYSVVDTVKIDDPEEDKRAKEAFINEILNSVDEENVKAVVNEIQKKKQANSSNGDDKKPLGAQITKQIAESMPDEIDDFAAKFFA